MDKVIWHTWPEGDGGPSQGCGPSAGDIAEEGGILSLSHLYDDDATDLGHYKNGAYGVPGGAGTGPLLYLFRTETGYMNQCRSFGWCHSSFMPLNIVTAFCCCML